MQSELKDLRKEIAYDEAKMNMSFSISKNVLTKEIIEGSRILSEKLNINKAAGKGLFLEAKDALLASGDEYARTEALLKEKMIAHALDIQKQRIEKKEEKRKEKEQQKQLDLSQPNASKATVRTSERGPTIRGAYEKVEAAKSQKVTQEEENRDSACENIDLTDDVDLQSMSIEGGSGAAVDTTRRAEKEPATATASKVLRSSPGKSSQAQAAATPPPPPPPAKKSAKQAPPRSNEQLELESRKLRNLLNNKKCLANYKVSFHPMPPLFYFILLVIFVSCLSHRNGLKNVAGYLLLKCPVKF